MILALETSTQRPSVALLEGGVLRRELVLEDGGRQGRDLAPAIERLGSLSAVRLVAVGLGPGSYTGLRVGLALAQSLAYAARLDVKGVSSFAAHAFDVLSEGEEMLTLCKAGREDYYYAVFSKEGGRLREIVPHAIGPESEMLKLRVPGRRVQDASPSAGAVGRLARISFQEDGPTPHDGLLPLYLRRSKAEINWERRKGG
jgi:tRNA threonylcarbamoyladenosine biosynthesis protein TsaB